VEEIQDDESGDSIKRCECPGCDSNYDISESALGQWIKCPKCENSFLASEKRKHAVRKHSKGSQKNRSSISGGLQTMLGCLGILILGLGIGVVMALFGMGGRSSSSSNSSATSESSESGSSNDTSGAWVWAKNFVEARLKSPKSAEFPWYSSSYVSPLGDDRYLVRSYVDATNSFNASIRTQFTAIVVKDSSGDWSLESLDLRN
jgi:hypothetical protein